MAAQKRRKAASRSAREIARDADRILQHAANKTREFEQQGQQTVTLPRAELIRKLSGKTAHSPFLTQIAWGAAVRGSTFVLDFGIMNPDPVAYSDGYLALCIYWSLGAGIAAPGESLLLADKSLGVLAINLGILNPSSSPYYISANHVLPTGLAAGSPRSDLNYLLYLANAFETNALLERGSLSMAVG